MPACVGVWAASACVHVRKSVNASVCMSLACARKFLKVNDGDKDPGTPSQSAQPAQ